ncbi:phage tail tape measure protein [Clostridium butyricum]|uniref:phage tail tape measure protein n=1 Tax=Clostridium butyricum TaxID=1492 RepID=UPI00374FAB87
MAGDANTVVAKIGLDDKGFQDGIGKVQRSLKLVQSEFAAASTKIGVYGKATETLKLKQDTLNKQMELQKQKVAALSKSYEESVQKKGEDAKATENLKIRLNYAQAELNNMERELGNVNRELQVQSSGWTQLGAKFDGIGNKMKTVGAGFSNTGKVLTTTVTAPIVAAGTGLVKLASDFQEANNTIRIGTGATGEALQGLQNDFKAVYTSVNTNISDASQVIADLNTRTGLSGESLQTLSTQMLRLAKITGEDINTLIPASTRMFQDAGISTEDYGDALDYTFKVSQSTGIGVSRLQELMTKFGGPLRQMGFDWQTSAAMLGKFEKEGVNTELVLGSLRIALGKMAKEGISEPNKALQEMITRIKEAGTAGEANTLAMEMFGAKAGPDMAAAIREGRLDLDELISSIGGSSETIEKAAKDTETIGDKFIILKNKMAVSLEPLGTKLIEAVESAMPSIEKLIDGITGIIEKFTSLSPAQQDLVIKFAMVAAAIGPVLSVIGKVITIGGTLFSTFGTISTAIGGLSGATGALGTAFAALTGPVGIIIAAIAGLIAVFVTLYNSNEEFRNTVNTVWNEVKTIISGIIEALKVLFSTFIEFAKQIWDKYGQDIMNIITVAFNFIANYIKNSLEVIKNVINIATNILKGNWQGVWDSIKNITSLVWDNLKNIISTTLNTIKGVVNTVLTFIKNIISTVWNAIKTLTDTTWNAIKTVTSTVWESIKNTISNIINGIKNLISTTFNAISSTISGIWNSIKNTTVTLWNGVKTAIITPVNEAKNTVKSAVDSIYGFFKNLKIPEIKIPKIKLPHFSLSGKFSIDPPSIPKFSVDWYAKGGIFNAPSIIGVGEAGSEAVLPIDRLDDLMARALQKVSGSTNEKNDGGLNITIENFINNTEKDIEQLAYELEFYRQRISMGRGGK